LKLLLLPLLLLKACSSGQDSESENFEEAVAEKYAAAAKYAADAADAACDANCAAAAAEALARKPVMLLPYPHPSCLKQIRKNKRGVLFCDLNDFWFLCGLFLILLLVGRSEKSVK
jgi:hypothetical protein